VLAWLRPAATSNERERARPKEPLDQPQRGSPSGVQMFILRVFLGNSRPLRRFGAETATAWPSTSDSNSPL
jgi:hypothetical protein